MPVTIGAKPEHGFDQPLGLLSDCHRRIERFLEVMLRVLDRAAGHDRLTADERSALEAALQYFDVAAPRHTHDEEESLFPRMRAATGDEPAVHEAMARLDALEADHRRAEAMHADVEQLCRQWVSSGKLPPAHAERLRSLLTELRQTYALHIALEDEQVFPLAARILTPVQLDEVGREMAQRRGIGRSDTHFKGGGSK